MTGPIRRSLLCTAATCALLLPAPARAQDALFHVFGAYVDALRTQVGIPGLSVAIVAQQDIAWEAAFGQQDISRSVAARTDTPFQIDGLTQVLTASLVLRCVEEGQLSLADPIGKYDAAAPEPTATIAQLLAHTSGDPGGLVFAYNPARLAPLAFALSACSKQSSREMFSGLFDRLAMIDSVPGADSITLVPPYEGVTPAAIARYATVLKRLAVPYSVDQQGNATVSQYAATTLTPSAGVISTVDDLAEFDLALKSGVLLKPQTLAAAWQPPVGPQGTPLPHGLGWFVQTFNQKTVVWQFGVGPNASSSLMVMLPSQGLTLIMLANSDGLVKPFALSAGDVIASPFARVFLSVFAR